MSELETKLKIFGFDDKLIKQILKSDKTQRAIVDVIDETKLHNVDKPTTTLLYELTTLYPTQQQYIQYRHNIINYILNNKIKTKKQIEGAIQYIKT